MTQRSLPWDGTSLDDAGPYGADDWQEFQQQIFNDQDTASDRGPIWTDYQDSLKVQEHSTPNMSVDVLPGAAVVDGTAYWSTATENLAITAAHPTLNRIDRVIVRLDDTLGKVRLAVKAGTASASPSPPTLQKDRSPYFEIPLYQVYVGAAVTSIYNSNLTDERQFVGGGAPLPSSVIDYNDEAGGISLSIKQTWTDMDATNLKIDLSTTGNPVEVWASIPWTPQYVGGGQFTLDVDFTYDGNRFNYAQHSKASGLARWRADINYLTTGPRHMLVFGPVQLTGLSAGSHTFKLQWRMDDAGTQTVYMEGTTIFGVREVRV